MTVDELIKDLESNDYFTRWFAAEILGTQRNLSKEQILQIVHASASSDVGEVLIWGLGQMHAAGTEDAIEPFLEHKINYFRWRAAEALRDLGTDRARQILEKYLETSSESETRWKCAWALGEIGSMDSFTTLWKHLEDEDRYTRWKSVWAISILKGDVETFVRNKLISGLDDYLAWRAVWILSRVGNSNTMTFLRRIKTESLYSSRYVQFQIDLAIRKISNKNGQK